MTTRRVIRLLSPLLTLTIATAVDAAAPASGDPPSPTATLARARQAQGGAAWDALVSLKLEGTFGTGGLEGPMESVVDLTTGRFRDTWVMGPLKGAGGWDGTRAWTQDASGVPRVEGAEGARKAAISDAYRRAQAYWFEARAAARLAALGERRDGARTFQVLSITPAGGRPFELWVGEDGLFDRFSEEDEGRTLTTFLSDWREVAGVKLPFSLRTTTGDGEAAHDQTVRWTKAEPGAAVSDATFALPPAPPPDSGFLRGARETTVPFEVINGHIYLDVMLDGKGPFRMLVDTGGVNIVTPALAQQLGLAAEGKLAAGGAGEAREDLGVAKVKRVRLGDAYLDDQTFFVYPMDKLEPVEGMKESGLIGYEVFRRFAARIDYLGRRLTLFEPSSFRYRGRGTTLPFVFNEHIPQVDGEIDGLKGKFDLDTGSRASLDLMRPFVGAHGLVAHYGVKTERIDGWGVGGPTRGYVTRAKELKLGPVGIPAPVISLSTQKTGAFASSEVAGNVGFGVLSRFTLYLDYAHQQVVLEKNARFARRDEFDKAGLWLHLDGGAFEVIEVVAGSPAAEAGLEAGDRILEVDGQAPAALTLHGVRSLLRERPAGTRIELKVRGAGGERAARLVLRELL